MRTPVIRLSDSENGCSVANRQLHWRGRQHPQIALRVEGDERNAAAVGGPRESED